jgi:hypothetical protein
MDFNFLNSSNRNRWVFASHGLFVLKFVRIVRHEFGIFVLFSAGESAFILTGEDLQE